VAYDHGIVSILGKGPEGLVSDWDIVYDSAGFEGDFWDDGEGLIGDQAGKRVLRL
jgi:hypothetical protein